MAVVIEEANLDSIVTDTGNDYTVVDGGDSIISVTLATDGDSDLGTRDTFTLGGTAYDQENTHKQDGTQSPFFKAAVGAFNENTLTNGIKEWLYVISTGAANECAYFIECSGVDQSAAIDFDEVLVNNSTASVMPTHVDVVVGTGDLVILMGTCGTAQVVEVPATALGGVDAWTTQCNDIAGLVGGGVNGGSVFTAIATGDYTTNITMILSASTNIQASYCVVIKAAVLGTSAALTGTAIAGGVTEAEIVSGGETIIITLTNDTWVASGATFNAQRQAIIDGMDAASSPALGWNDEVRDKEVVTAVVRDSNTQVTITLTASGDYDISADETITVTVPATALVTSGIDVEADDTFDVTAAVAAGQTIYHLPLIGVG